MSTNGKCKFCNKELGRYDIGDIMCQQCYSYLRTVEKQDTDFLKYVLTNGVKKYIGEHNLRIIKSVLDERGANQK